MYMLCALVAVVVAVLALPVAIRLAVAREEPGEAPDLGGTAALAFGLVGVAARGRGNLWELRVHLFGFSLPRPVISLGSGATTGEGAEAITADKHKLTAAPEEAGAAVGEKPDEGEPAPATRGPLAALRRVMDLLDLAGAPALSLVRSLPRVLHLRRGRVSGRYGFSDPGQTGRVFGALQALQAHTWQRLQVRLQPDWADTEVRVRVDVLLHFHLGLLLCYVLRCAAQVSWRWLAGRVTSWTWLPGAAR